VTAAGLGLGWAAAKPPCPDRVCGPADRRVPLLELPGPDTGSDGLELWTGAFPGIAGSGGSDGGLGARAGLLTGVGGLGGRAIGGVGRGSTGGGGSRGGPGTLTGSGGRRGGAGTVTGSGGRRGGDGTLTGSGGRGGGPAKLGALSGSVSPGAPGSRPAAAV
jgi:hypothetical protein